MYLNCHSYYSLRYGAMSEVDLLEYAQRMQVQSIALTDINNTSACLNFIRKAKTYDIKPLVGIDIRNDIQSCFVVIAKNNEGFREMNDYLSTHLTQKKRFELRAPSFENCFVIYPFEQALYYEIDDLAKNEFIGISLAEAQKVGFSKFSKQPDRLVILQTVSFRDKKDFNKHRLLRAIALNTLLSKLPEEQQADLSDQMYAIEELHARFEHLPCLIQNTTQLIAACEVNFDFSEQRKSLNLQTYTGSIQKDRALLRKLSQEGIKYRYQNVNTQLKQRIEKELDLIEKKEFVSYFLINYDIVNYARQRGFHYVGRGSGANSVIAYLLRITDVDPVELDLYFERFINLYRATPPDFDIDFSWRDRDQIIDYIHKRFANVCLLGTYVTFKKRAILRELSKVFGLPKDEIDHLVRGLKPSHSRTTQQRDQIHRLIFKYAQELEGIPNYLSVHAGGILISQKPIQYYTAVFLPPKGYPTTQFDMHIAEDVGLYKFDILAQRGISKIKDAVEIIRYNQPDCYPQIDIHDIKKFKQDVKINALIKSAQCMGCFYVESPAMRMLLKKLEVDHYLGLVAASSIIRPGVSKSGMMREYIMRHRNPSRAKEKAHEVLLAIMPETYGVMVYQEDVIKVAHLFAGLDLGQADVLRRGMSGKYRSRSEFERVKHQFFKNCKQKAYADQLVQEIWFQIESFAGYAFAKGHSASYAVESYQSLFLKTYFPLEYMVAVLNNGGGFYKAEFYIHEARMLGAQIEAPCVNNSFSLNRIEGKTIFLGFMYVKELEEKVVQKIVEAREKDGLFSSLENFIDRVALSVEQLSLIIRVGAFRFTAYSKHQLLWKAHLLTSKSTLSETPKLFNTQENQYQIPILNSTNVEQAFEELELLGFSLETPFELLKNPVKHQVFERNFKALLGEEICIYGYLVTVKPTKTQHGKLMQFATFLDREGKVFDAVAFPSVAQKGFFRGLGIYKCKAVVVEEFGYYSLNLISAEKLPMLDDPRYSENTRIKGAQSNLI